ncbi:hypothetical protein D4Q80_03940, partial [bacterium]
MVKSIETKTNKTKKASSKASVLNSSKSSLNGTRGEPQTMDELLKQSAYKFYGFRRGDVIEGIVTEKTKKAVWVDIGTKTEG